MRKVSKKNIHPVETMKRSIVKTLTYRVLILILDFTSIYIFTGQVKIALGFMIVSNVYTTISYYFHERIWDRITWGKIINNNTLA
jgi:adenylylsulfate kinase